MKFVIGLLFIFIFASCVEQAGTDVSQAGKSTLKEFAINGGANHSVEDPGQQFELKGICNITYNDIQISFDGATYFTPTSNQYVSSNSDLNCTNGDFNIIFNELTTPLGFDQQNVGKPQKIYLKANSTSGKNISSIISITSEDAFPPAAPKTITVSSPLEPLIKIIDKDTNSDTHHFECKVDDGAWWLCADGDDIFKDGSSLNAQFYGNIYVKAVDGTGNESEITQNLFKKGNFPNSITGQLYDITDIGNGLAVAYGDIDGINGDKANISIVDKEINHVLNKDFYLDKLSFYPSTFYLDSFYSYTDSNIIRVKQDGTITHFKEMNKLESSSGKQDFEFLVEDKVNGDIYIYTNSSIYGDDYLGNGPKVIKVSSGGTLDSSFDYLNFCTSLPNLPHNFRQQKVGNNFIIYCDNVIKEIQRDTSGIASNYSIIKISTTNFVNDLTFTTANPINFDFFIIDDSDHIIFYNPYLTHINGTPVGRFARFTPSFTYLDSYNCSIGGYSIYRNSIGRTFLEFNNGLLHKIQNEKLSATYDLNDCSSETKNALFSDQSYLKSKKIYDVNDDVIITRTQSISNYQYSTFFRQLQNGNLIIGHGKQVKRDSVSLFTFNKDNGNIINTVNLTDPLFFDMLDFTKVIVGPNNSLYAQSSTHNFTYKSPEYPSKYTNINTSSSLSLRQQYQSNFLYILNTKLEVQSMIDFRNNPFFDFDVMSDGSIYVAHVGNIVKKYTSEGIELTGSDLTGMISNDSNIMRIKLYSNQQKLLLGGMIKTYDSQVVESNIIGLNISTKSISSSFPGIEYIAGSNGFPFKITEKDNYLFLKRRNKTEISYTTPVVFTHDFYSFMIDTTIEEPYSFLLPTFYSQMKGIINYVEINNVYYLLYYVYNNGSYIIAIDKNSNTALKSIKLKGLANNMHLDSENNLIVNFSLHQRTNINDNLLIKYDLNLNVVEDFMGNKRSSE